MFTLAHVTSTLHFYTPWKSQKTSSFQFQRVYRQNIVVKQAKYKSLSSNAISKDIRVIVGKRKKNITFKFNLL